MGIIHDPVNNSDENITHPCFILLFTLNYSDVLPASSTQLMLPSYLYLMMFTNTSGIPYCLNSFHNISCLTLSNALLNSMMFMYRGACHSMIFLSTNICSNVPLPLLNLAYSSLSFLSTPFFILSNRILQKKKLAGTDRRGTPIELSPRVGCPFFGILTMRDLFQSLGTFRM